ncbi:MAG: hypothetical protein QM770_05225 [Tepidisphaeraceae bacterium]
MDDSPVNEEAEAVPASKPVLDYATPVRRSFRRPWDWIDTTAVVLTPVTYIAQVMAGVASDWTRIPTPKKVVLTLATVIVVGLLNRATKDRHQGCVSLGALAAFVLLLGVPVMWFWN